MSDERICDKVAYDGVLRGMEIYHRKRTIVRECEAIDDELIEMRIEVEPCWHAVEWKRDRKSVV